LSPQYEKWLVCDEDYVENYGSGIMPQLNLTVLL